MSNNVEQMFGFNKRIGKGRYRETNDLKIAGAA